MKSICIKFSLSLFISVFTLLYVSSGAWAREIIDMTGRRVSVPDEITKIYSGSPPGYAILYSLAPELLCGRAMRAGSAFEQRLLRPDVAATPLIGTFGGQNTAMNIETLLKAKPDLIIELVMADPENAADAMYVRTNETLERLGIPYIYVCAKDITAYPRLTPFWVKFWAGRNAPGNCRPISRALWTTPRA